MVSYTSIFYLCMCVHVCVACVPKYVHTFTISPLLLRFPYWKISIRNSVLEWFIPGPLKWNFHLRVTTACWMQLAQVSEEGVKGGGEEMLKNFNSFSAKNSSTAKVLLRLQSYANNCHTTDLCGAGSSWWRRVATWAENMKTMHVSKLSNYGRNSCYKNQPAKPPMKVILCGPHSAIQTNWDLH
jgi:hypothetical protein